MGLKIPSPSTPKSTPKSSPSEGGKPDASLSGPKKSGDTPSNKSADGAPSSPGPFSNKSSLSSNAFQVGDILTVGGQSSKVDDQLPSYNEALADRPPSYSDAASQQAESSLNRVFMMMAAMLGMEQKLLSQTADPKLQQSDQKISTPGKDSKESLQDPNTPPEKKVRTSEKDTSVPLTEENLKNRPKDDHRNADQILNDNPTLKNLGDQKDIKRKELKERFGDWTADNKDEKSRADAAYKVSSVINNIKSLKNREGGDRDDVKDNGKIEGITNDGDARRGSEAGVLKDVAEKGLSELPKNKQLPKTNDSQVFLNGTNQDNFQSAMGKIADVLKKIPILKSLVAPVFDGMSKGDGFLGVLKGGFKGVGEVIPKALELATSVFRGGPAGVISQLAKTAVEDTVSITTETVSESISKHKSKA